MGSSQALFKLDIPYLCGMTQQEALAIVGISDENLWEEQLVQHVFEMKQFVLKAYHAPAVLRAKSKKAFQWAEAESILKNSYFMRSNRSETYPSLPPLTPNISDLIIFYRTFESALSNLKMQLLQATETLKTAEILELLAVIEENRLTHLSQLTEQFRLYPTPTDVKLSEFINSGEIVRTLLPYENKLLTQSLLLEQPLLNRELDKSLKFSNFTKK
jgi:hypothetical protein